LDSIAHKKKHILFQKRPLKKLLLKNLIFYIFPGALSNSPKVQILPNRRKNLPRSAKKVILVFKKGILTLTLMG
jgi:hypothetical protein